MYAADFMPPKWRARTHSILKTLQACHKPTTVFPRHHTCAIDSVVIPLTAPEKVPVLAVNEAPTNPAEAVTLKTLIAALDEI